MGRIEEVLETVQNRNPHEPEFLQLFNDYVEKMDIPHFKAGNIVDEWDNLSKKDVKDEIVEFFKDELKDAIDMVESSLDRRKDGELTVNSKKFLIKKEEAQAFRNYRSNERYFSVLELLLFSHTWYRDSIGMVPVYRTGNYTWIAKEMIIKNRRKEFLRKDIDHEKIYKACQQLMQESAEGDWREIQYSVRFGTKYQSWELPEPILKLQPLYVWIEPNYVEINYFSRYGLVAYPENYHKEDSENELIKGLYLYE